MAIMAMMLAVGADASAQKRNKKSVECTGGNKVCAEACAQRLSAKLLLDDATAAKFEPLYKEYMEALAACRVQKPEGEPTDAARIENLENRFEAQAKAAAVKKTYVGKFAKILTPRQVEQVMSKKPGMPSNDKMKGGKGNARFAKKGDCRKDDGCRKGDCKKEHSGKCAANRPNGACADSAAVRK